jgi:hypothetical protein
VACVVTISLYAFAANYISACIAPVLPAWNHVFPHDRRPLRELMGFVAVWAFPEVICSQVTAAAG